MRSLFWHAIKKAIRPIIEIHRVFFFETDLTQPSPTVNARIPLEIRPVRLEDLDAWADELEAGGIDRQRARHRLERGEVGIVAVSGRQPAHVQWIAFSPVWVSEIGVTLVPGPGEAYSYDTVTLPGWRGNGIHPAVSSFINQYERSLGYTRHISYVRADNVQSLKVTRTKLARRQTKTVWRIRIRGMKGPLILGATRQGSPSLALPS